jgi:hypothetical protein
VYRPAHLSAGQLEAGYRQAYHQFYSWSSILHGAWEKLRFQGKLRHLAYAGGWKKFEPLWDVVIRLKQVPRFLPLLEKILSAGSELNQRCADLQKPASSSFQQQPRGPEPAEPSHH